MTKIIYQPFRLRPALSALLLIVGCVRQPVQMQTKFDYSEHKPYADRGENTVKVQDFLRQQGGGVVTCAGSEAILIPNTPFFREAFKHYREIKKPQPAEKISPEFRSMVKRSQCDAQGNFAFHNVPDGSWFLFTPVTWQVRDSEQGGMLVREIKVANKEVTPVLLSETGRPDRYELNDLLSSFFAP